MRATTREKDDLAKKLDESRATSKRLTEENRQIKQSQCETQQTSRAKIESMTRENDRLSHELRRLRNKADNLVCNAVQEECARYAKFVSFTNEHLLPQSNELPVLYGNLVLRMDTVPQGSASLKLEPDYKKLLSEVQLVKLVSHPPPTVAGAQGGFSAHTPSVPAIQKIAAEVGKHFDQLKEDEIYSLLLQVKKSNNNRLKTMSMNEILSKIGELKDDEGIAERFLLALSTYIVTMAFLQVTNAAFVSLV